MHWTSPVEMLLNPYVQGQRQAGPIEITTAKYPILRHPGRIASICSLCSRDSSVIGFLTIAQGQKMTTTPKAPHVSAWLSLGDPVPVCLCPQRSQAPDYLAASKITQQVAKPHCWPWLQHQYPPLAQNSCSTTTSPSNSVSFVMSLKLSLNCSGNCFLLLFVLCLFRNIAFVSMWLHWAAPHPPNTSFCQEFCLSNAHLKNANFLQMRNVLRHYGYRLGFCGDQRIWQCYTVMTLLQCWKWKKKNHWNAVSHIYSISLWIAAPISCLWLPVGERKGTDYRHIPNVCFFHAFFREKQEISLFFFTICKAS